jgi:nicotinamide-nucleotide amidase
MMPDDEFIDPLHEVAERVIEIFSEKEVMISTVESCTGGMISAALTDIAGSSNVLERGYVTYSNAAKEQMVDVPEALIEKHGAVSSEVAAAMAEGGLARSDADLAIAVTGIAGPGGGSAEKPVGLVWFACAMTWGPTLVLSNQFDDNGRDFIRYHTTMFALQIVLEMLESRQQNEFDEPQGNA